MFPWLHGACSRRRRRQKKPRRGRVSRRGDWASSRLLLWSLSEFCGTLLGDEPLLLKDCIESLFHGLSLLWSELREKDGHRQAIAFSINPKTRDGLRRIGPTKFPFLLLRGALRLLSKGVSIFYHAAAVANILP